MFQNVLDRIDRLEMAVTRLDDGVQANSEFVERIRYRVDGIDRRITEWDARGQVDPQRSEEAALAHPLITGA
eukprot:628129-Prorocentrum_lima.AAC.1